MQEISFHYSMRFDTFSLAHFHFPKSKGFPALQGITEKPIKVSVFLLNLYLFRSPSSVTRSLAIEFIILFFAHRLPVHNTYVRAIENHSAQSKVIQHNKCVSIVNRSALFVCVGLLQSTFFLRLVHTRASFVQLWHIFVVVSFHPLCARLSIYASSSLQPFVSLVCFGYLICLCNIV